MRVITVSNIKGGVAKTTTAATLAAGLNKRGLRVLLIDSDPQMNLTLSFIEEPEGDYQSLYTVYDEKADLRSIRLTIREGLDIIPGDFELCSADMEFFKRAGALKSLSHALKKVEEDYDYVVIDTPPNLGFLSLNAFISSNYIITPMSADSFSLKAVTLLKQTLDEVSEDIGHEIPVAGILMTRYSDRTNVAKALEESIVIAADLLNTRIFKNRVRQATVVQESQIAKTDLFSYAPKSSVAADYDGFISEFLESIGE